MSLKRAIQKTIDYAGSFGSEINFEEITERLISDKEYPISEIKKNISKSFLSKKTNPWKKNKILKAKKLGIFLKKNFPDILFLGISGSVASGHPKKNDDIDLILVTKKNKLWLTRFKLRITIFLNKIPHRRYGQKEMKNDFCFNLWLDENGLKLPKERQTLQSAVDLIMIVPIFDRQNIYQKLLLKNNWAKKYLATGYSKKISNFQFLMSNKKTNILDEIINKLFFWPQYWYMKGKITGEEVNLHQAFFYERVIE